MKVCIHRGTREIGGTCLEIEAEGKRIVLDVGLPLNFDEQTESRDTYLPPVKGFREPDASLLGIFVSHPHQDHYGLSDLVPGEVPVIIGEAAKRILTAANQFLPRSAGPFENTITLQDGKMITLGPFRVTPYLVDHSAYDAYALLVEAGGKRLFYSGDFRGHGRKSALFERLLKNPPKEVDTLLMEGSTLGRIKEDEAFPSEADIETELVNHIKGTKGLELVFCSSQNIDRIVTIYRACKRTGRQMIIDLYTAAILEAPENHNIPQSSWPNVRLFIPEWQRRHIKRNELFNLLDRHKSKRIFPEALAPEASLSVMLFRPSFIRDLDQANCLTDAAMIYSLWNGYLKTERFLPFITWLENTKIPMTEIHTSGHASIKDLRRFAEAISPRRIIPIHTFERNKFPELFSSVEVKDDGQWWTV